MLLVTAIHCFIPMNTTRLSLGVWSLPLKTQSGSFDVVTSSDLTIVSDVYVDKPQYYISPVP